MFGFEAGGVSGRNVHPNVIDQTNKKLAMFGAPIEMDIATGDAQTHYLFCMYLPSPPVSEVNAVFLTVCAVRAVCDIGWWLGGYTPL